MKTRLYHTVATIFRLVAASFKHLNDVLGLACVAGVKRGRASRPYSLPLPFRTPATQAMLDLKSSLRIVSCSITLSSPKRGKRGGGGGGDGCGRPSAATMPSTNLSIFGVTKPTLLWLNSFDFRSSSSSSLEKNVSLGISPNSLPSLLELEPIRCSRDWTANEAAEARGALDRASPGHQVSRL